MRLQQPTAIATLLLGMALPSLAAQQPRVQQDAGASAPDRVHAGGGRLPAAEHDDRSDIILDLIDIKLGIGNKSVSDVYRESALSFVQRLSRSFNGELYEPDMTTSQVTWRLRREPLGENSETHRLGAVFIGPCIHDPKTMRSPPDVFVVDPRFMHDTTSGALPDACQRAHDRGIQSAYFSGELPALIVKHWLSDELVRDVSSQLYREAISKGDVVERFAAQGGTSPGIPTRLELFTFLNRLSQGVDAETLPMLKAFIEEHGGASPRALYERGQSQKKLEEVIAKMGSGALLPWERFPLMVNAEKFVSWCVYLKLMAPLNACFGQKSSFTEWDQTFESGRTIPRGEEENPHR